MGTAEELVALLARLIEKDQPLTNPTLLKDVHFRMEEMLNELTLIRVIEDPNCDHDWYPHSIQTCMRCGAKEEFG